MTKIITEFVSIGEEELEKSFADLDKASQKFEKSLNRSGKTSAQSVAQLRSLAQLNKQLARIYDQQAKGNLTAAQTQALASKARVAAAKRELAIIKQQGATQDQVSKAELKLAKQKAQLTQSLNKLNKERKRAIAAAEKETAAQQKSAAVTTARIAADQKAQGIERQKAAAQTRQAKLLNELSEIQKRASKQQINSAQAAIASSQAKEKALARELAAAKSRGDALSTIAAIELKLNTQRNKTQVLIQKETAAQQKAAATAARRAAAQEKAAARATAQAQKQTAVAAQQVQREKILATAQQRRALLHQRIGKIQDAQAKGTLTAGQAEVRISRAKVAAAIQEVNALKNQGASVDRVAKAQARLSAEKLKLVKGQQRLSAESKKVAGSLNKIDGSARKATGGLGLIQGAIGGFAAGAAVKGIDAIHSAIVAAGNQVGESVKEFAQLDQSLTTFRALTGLKVKSGQFQAVEKEVKSLGATTTFTAGEVGALAVSLSRGGLSAKEVERSLKSVTQAAIASNADLVRTGEIITQISNTFEEDFGRTSDILVTAANSSSTTLEELGGAFANVGPLAKQAGLDTEEAAKFFALFASAGVRGAEAGTALRGTLNRLVPAIDGLKNGTEGLKPAQKRLVKTLQELGLSYQDFLDSTGGLDGQKTLETLSNSIAKIEDPTAKARLAIRAFGDEYGSKVLGLLTRSPAIINKQSKAFDGLGGAAERTAAVMQQSLEARFKILGSAVSGFRTELGASLAPVLEPLLEEAGEFFTGLTDLLTQGGVGNGISDTLGAIAGGLIDEFKAGFGSLELDIFEDIFENLVPVIGSVGQALKDLQIGARIGELTNVLGAVGNDALEALGPTLTNGVTATGNAISTVIDTVTTLIEAARDLGILDVIFTVAKKSITQTIAIINVASGILRGLVGIIKLISPAFAPVGVAVKALLIPFNILHSVVQLISQGIAKLGGLIQGLGEFAQGARSQIANAFVEAFEGPLSQARDSLQLVLDLISVLPGVDLELPEIGLGDQAGKVEDEAARLAQAKEIYAAAVNEFGDAIDFQETKAEIQQRFDEAGLGDIDVSSVENAVRLDKFIDINEGVAELGRAAELVEQKTAELGERAETEWGKQEIRNALATEKFADATEEELRLAATKTGQAQLVIERAIAELGENASAEMQRQAAEQAIAAGNFSDVAPQAIKDAITETITASQAYQQALKEEGQSNADAVEEGNEETKSALERRKELFSEASDAVEERLSEDTAAITDALNQQIREINDQVENGDISALEGAKRKDAATTDSTRDQLELIKEEEAAVRAALESTTAVGEKGNAERERLAAELVAIEGKKNEQLQALREAELTQLRTAETTLEATLQEQLNDRKITAEQAAVQRTTLAAENAEKELEILEQTNASAEELEQQRLKIAEAQAAKLAAIKAEALAKIKRAEQERLVEIAKLEADGLKSTEAIELAKAQAAAKRARETLEALEEQKVTEDEINAATLEALEAQKAAEQALIAVINARIELQGQVIESRLQKQIDLINQSTNALNRQKSIIESIGSLQAAQNALSEARANIEIDRLKRGKELLEQQDELLGKTQEISEEEQKARDLATVQGELRDRGFNPNADPDTVLLQRLDAEKQAAKDREAALQRQLALQRQAAAIEAQLAVIAARRAVFEAKIAENTAIQEAQKAKALESDLRADLAAAQEAGDAERVKELQQQLELNQSIQDAAELAKQNTQDAIAGVGFAEFANQNAQQQLAAEQQTQLVDFNAQENERRIAAANERSQAGLSRGPVELLPTDGTGIDFSQDAEIAQQVEGINQQITSEAQRQNELSQERQILNDIEIEQQKQLLELERQRGAGNAAPSGPVIPAFRTGGAFNSGTRQIMVGDGATLGRAAPEIVKFAGGPSVLAGLYGPEILNTGGKSGFVYNAARTAQVIRSLPTKVNSINMPAAAATMTVASRGSSGAGNSALLQEIKGLRADLKGAPRKTEIHQHNTTTLSSLSDAEVDRRIRQRSLEGVKYIARKLGR
ncbi:MAG: phage tail tape measure protein [Spirulina sp. SIO3F2]|nr:phage tail tape measure protein [Spirulina sp. SIO3F2]